jgi:GTP-binding protein HflX
MTGAGVMAENLLFATLDPTMRQIGLPGIDKAILSDTVGFVSDLPTQLVAAFRATLEEVLAADLIVHVRDIAHPDSKAQAADVETVLAELGIGGDGEGARAIPMIEAWNKIDRLDADQAARVTAEAARRADVVALSALTGKGVEALGRLLAERLSPDSQVHSIALDAGDGGAIAWLHAHGEVMGEAAEADRLVLDVRLTPLEWARFQAR